MTREQWWIVPLDFLLAFLLAVELAARTFAEENRRRHLLSFTMLADVVVIGSLLLPAFVDNLAFLRVLRALVLLRSYHLPRDLEADSAWFRLHEDIIQRTLNLGVFIFIVTSAVFVTQNDINSGIFELLRCPLLHDYHAHDDGFRRRYPARTRGPAARHYHYVVVGVEPPLPALVAGHLPPLQSSL